MSQPDLVPREKPYADFFRWRDEDLRPAALAAGVGEATFARAFEGVVPVERVLALDAFQPEFVKPVWEYLDGALTAERIETGQARASEHKDLLARLEARFGVPGSILVAIWGLETSFGRIMGDHDVIASVATLAYQGRRQAFFRGELLAALTILEAGDAARLTGSWAGAMGHTQFMPTTFLAHAFDADEDGRRDIWNSIADALGSTAQYLQRSGWQAGGGWGEIVRLPRDFDYADAEITLTRPRSEWRMAGVLDTGGAPIAGEGAPAAIFLPAGAKGPAFLLDGNFQAILKYNTSTAYALAVGLLAEAIEGRGPPRLDWPRAERALSLEERAELQRLLQAQGFEIGEIDGVIGIKTRAAIRAAQARAGLVPDGFASAAFLDHLRGPDTAPADPAPRADDEQPGETQDADDEQR